jgi:hypothetical protein
VGTSYIICKSLYHSKIRFLGKKELSQMDLREACVHGTAADAETALESGDNVEESTLTDGVLSSWQ